MRIITISRQFGSGGRELGKRLADVLGFDYYDREIIDTLAERQNLDPEYVRSELSYHGWNHVHLTYHSSFSTVMPVSSLKTQLMSQERELIRQIPESGNDFIIIGRNAEVILEEYKPFCIFVCASLEDRLARCMEHEKKRPVDEQLPEKQVLKNIKRIDKERIQTREILTGRDLSDMSTYDMTVNAGGRNMKKLAQAVGEFALRWFEEETE